MKRSFLLAAAMLLLFGCSKAPAPSQTEPAPPEEKKPMPYEKIIELPESMKPDKARNEFWIKIDSMTLEQKAYQIILASCHDPSTAEKAASLGIGGICLYKNFFESRDKTSAAQEIARLQELAQTPMLVSTDEEGGTVLRISRYKAYRSDPFPSPAAAFSAGGWKTVEAIEREKAALLISLGVNVNLAPVCDTALSSADYIYPRCFSTDAGQNARFAALAVGVYKEAGLGAVAKHFPGYGGNRDTHVFSSYDARPLEQFEERDLVPFAAAIKAGCGAVMISHNVVACFDESSPASLSKPVHDYLRNRMSFCGVMLTDDLTMQAAGGSSDAGSAAVAAVLAGNDMICIDDFESAAEAIIRAVKSGVIDERELDRSVLRILRWKRSLGLDIR